MKVSLNLVKDIIFIINAVFFVIGIIVFIVCIIGFTFTNGHRLIFKQTFEPVLIFGIVLGILIIIMSIFGHIGVHKESRCILLVHTIFIFLLIVGEISILFVLIIQKPSNEIALDHFLVNAYNNYGNSTAEKNVIDSFQSQLHCCGYNKTLLLNNTIPTSCCVKNVECSSANVFKRNCLQVLMQSVGIEIIIGIVIIVLLIILGIINSFFSCVLAKHFDEGYDELK